MAKVEFVLNPQGVRELLKSKEMMDVCREYADRAQQSLGAGYKVSEHTGPNRVNVEVAAETFEAKRENLKHNTILKAVLGT